LKNQSIKRELILIAEAIKDWQFLPPAAIDIYARSGA
jgi:hypothetical protein